MFVTLVATMWQSRWLAINSWGFVIAATITSIFKDRVKEWVKRYFSRKMTRWVPDVTVAILDPVTGTRIGRCREAFSYVPYEKVPPDILERRGPHPAFPLDPARRPEYVLKYEKEVRIRGGEMISRLRQSHYEVNDILRFEIGRFLERTDDPTFRLPVFDDAKDRVEVRELPKVYHLNYVLRLSTPKGGTKGTMTRVRVVFDRRGIRRLEHE
jgi:hypothetical protein